MEVLAAANDGGLTEGSQPGEVATFHELPWRQRAFVSGFVADPALARALCARAAEAGLVVPCAPGPAGGRLHRRRQSGRGGGGGWQWVGVSGLVMWMSW
ncbi:hypothetical protein [Streptomyces afghaniensis]|uniref:hypothetical protein n=1 Tax=Streptomyces afghaniensis TaxID=66865 RepID=UPI003F4BB520